MRTGLETKKRVAEGFCPCINRTAVDGDGDGEMMRYGLSM